MTLNLTDTPLGQSPPNDGRLATPCPQERAQGASAASVSIPLAAALFALLIALVSPAVLGDGDTFWHIAAGDWILAHRAVPQTDPFTFTFAGAPWTAHEWLSELFLTGAYRVAGWSGVVLLTGAALAAAAWILTRRLARDLEGTALIVAATLGLGLQLGSLLARPHILALPLLAAWAAGLFAARDRDRAPSLALLPIMTLWVNMHGSFLFGLALIGPFALEALLAAPPQKKAAVFRDWALFGALALGAALLNPRGFEALLFPLRLMGLKSLAGVAEWQPENFDRVGPLEIELFALLAFALLRPLRVAPLRLILLIGLIHLALHHTRHAMMLGLIAPMILARPIATAIGQPAPAPARVSRREIIASLALVLTLAGLRLAIPVTREDGPMAPLSALAAVPVELRERPVLNHYSFGGYLIFAGAKPYIDGRTDLFGDAFIDRYDRIVAADPVALDRALRENGIEWTIFPPSTAISVAMAARPDWRKIYADPFAVVFARNDAADLHLRP